jgi:hypothetical protein
VTAELEFSVVAPGEPLGVRLSVFPDKPVRINEATAEVRAREICVSGSGKNRSTHKHQIYSHVTPIPTPRSMEGGKLVTLRASVPIAQGAYSFASKDNKLVWEAVVRVDIPSWPDWEQVLPLVVWPAAAALEEPAMPAPMVEEATPPTPMLESTLVPVRSPEVITPSEERIGEEPPPHHRASDDVPGSGGGPDTDLAGAIREILDREIIGGDRDRRVKALVGTTVSFDLQVERVDRTFAMYSDPDYRAGRTVQGTVAGAELQVLVWFPEAMNGDLDSVQKGDVLRVRGEVREWDPLRRRPSVLAEP